MVHELDVADPGHHRTADITNGRIQAEVVYFPDAAEQARHLVLSSLRSDVGDLHYLRHDAAGHPSLARAIVVVVIFSANFFKRFVFLCPSAQFEGFDQPFVASTRCLWLQPAIPQDQRILLAKNEFSLRLCVVSTEIIFEVRCNYRVLL